MPAAVATKWKICRAEWSKSEPIEVAVAEVAQLPDPKSPTECLKQHGTLCLQRPNKEQVVSKVLEVDPVAPQVLAAVERTVHKAVR